MEINEHSSILIDEVDASVKGLSLKIGSRESPLAQLQAREVMRLLREAFAGFRQEDALSLRTYKTQGDLLMEERISEIGEKGLFVKELETALLTGEIDVAVHSMKDMPGELPQGLALQSAGPREDPRDVLVNRNQVSFSELPPGSVIGTSSVRRIAQLRHRRPDLDYQNIRGNLQTRLQKLETGAFDALVLAAAGLHRSGFRTLITQYFDPVTENIPAVCQGILAVEYRADDQEVRQALRKISHPAVETALLAERTVLSELGAGCSVPLGVYAYPEEGSEWFCLAALLFKGEERREASIRFRPQDVIPTGQQIAAIIR